MLGELGELERVGGGVLSATPHNETKSSKTPKAEEQKVAFWGVKRDKNGGNVTSKCASQHPRWRIEEESAGDERGSRGGSKGGEDDREVRERDERERESNSHFTLAGRLRKIREIER